MKRALGIAKGITRGITRGITLGAVALWASAAHAQATLPPPPPAAPVQALQAEIDSWVQRAADDSAGAAPALAALATLAERPVPHGVAAAANTRMVWLARGLVAAGAGRSEAAEQARAALAAMAAEPLAAADAHLVRAALADHRDDGPAVLAAGASALATYGAECPAAAGCDHRSSILARQLLARHEMRRGHTQITLDHHLAAADAARAAADRPRQALLLAMAADAAQHQGDSAQAARLLAQAQRLARPLAEPALRSRMQLYETRLHGQAGDTAAAERAARAGLASARQARSARLESTHLANLSDIFVKTGRPHDALRAVAEALPLTRRQGNPRTERVLLHNAALARVALGQNEAARGVMQEMLQGARQSGASADEATTLREFSDAFAAGGDLKTALELYHQERRLAEKIMATNRDTTLAQLRERFDREAQQRQLEQLARENTLITAELANRDLLRQLWAAGALALLLAGALGALLYQRVRAVNRQLTHNHAFLRAQSQRDPLTGLGNRRALHDLLTPAGQAPPYRGGLLLVDIDHFKHINDGHGHAAGDAVLVEVARRLGRAVREQDLVVRWGGEEFLIHMPGADDLGSAQVQMLAQRVLQAVGSTPVTVAREGAAPLALRVTVSIGHAAFPLAPHGLPLSAERAINLADMALYTAKGQGRNRAIGIASLMADGDAGLRRIEADFDHAWHQGEISLSLEPGPDAAPAPPAAPAARVMQPA